MPIPTTTDRATVLVLFDGDCAFCNNAVNFIRRHSAPRQFEFEPSGSERGQAILKQNGLPAEPKSIVLLTGGRAFLRSSATLRIARGLRWPWPIFSVFLLVPPFIRDAAYRVFAANRHRFARPDACELPPR